MDTFKSSISNTEFPLSESVLGKTVRPTIFHFIKTEYPDFDKKSLLSLSELNRFRQKYLEKYLINEAGELSKLELDVLASIEKKDLLTKSVGSDLKEDISTYGQRLADRVASFGGSWKFIIIFTIIIFVWLH